MSLVQDSPTAKLAKPPIRKETRRAADVAADALADAARGPRAGDVAEWVVAFRKAGLDRFEEVGFPPRLAEAWRHTDLRKLKGTNFVPGRAEADVGDLIDDYSLSGDAAVELVFVDGLYQPDDRSRNPDVAGVTVRQLAEVLSGGELDGKLGQLAQRHVSPFTALNDANLLDGAVIAIDAGAAVEKPIHLLFLSTGGTDGEGGGHATVSHPRTYVTAGEKAKATLVETYAGRPGATYLTNAVTEIVAGAGSNLDHVKLNRESVHAFHIALMEVHLGGNGVWTSHSGTLTEGLTRNDLNVTLAGPDAYATLNGLVIGTGRGHADNHTLLRHMVPDCRSYELYKHVMEDRSTGVFKGKIYVAQDAQKTDAVQNSRTLLLSDEARMNSQPALEIYADDVKCTHGSTTGPLDDGAIFYLNSRGVDPDMSRRLLTYAFAADVTRRIKVAAVRERIEAFMARQHGLPTDFRIQELAEATEGVVF